MPSQLYQDIVSLLDGQLTLPEDDFETAKDKMEAMHGHPIKDGTELSWQVFNGVRCAVLRAANVAEDTTRTLLYFRGGAFIAAGGDGFLFYGEMLSQLLDAQVIMVDYRLLPEHRFPAALEDCCNAYIGLLAEGYSAKSIGFIGDSCGGGLVIASLLKLRDDNVDLPGCGVSLCGWFDLSEKNERKDPLYHQAYSYRRGIDYAGKDRLQNPLVSPVYGDFTGLPPLLLQAGEIDPTSVHAKVIASKALKQGVHVELDIVSAMIHGFHGFANLGVPESVDALRRVRLFLSNTVDKST
jgi:acetyl esterase/lipase